MEFNNGLCLSLGRDTAIQNGRLIKFSFGFPIYISCKNGWLLVTIQEDVTDYILLGGDRVMLPRNKVALVEGSGVFVVAKEMEAGTVESLISRYGRVFFDSRFFGRIISIFKQRF